MYVQYDWTQFRTLESLCRRAGVPAEKLPALVAKEVADNALDETSMVRVGLIGDRGFFVEDEGEGIPGTPEEIADLFSIARPLTSSKVLRTPSRGRLGNGLRVVAGAVLATRGQLAVMTRGRRLDLEPRDDGTTAIIKSSASKQKTGTRIEVVFGEQLEIDEDILRYARQAIRLSGGGPTYAGRTSAWWYDADAFFEVLQAARGRTVRDVVASFEGWAEPKAGKGTREFHGRQAVSLSRTEASALLKRLREGSRPVKPKRLGFVGPEAMLGAGHAKVTATLHYHSVGGIRARIPIVVEAWAALAEDDEAQVIVHVNRTPVVGDVWASIKKNHLHVAGCGVRFEVPIGRMRAPIVWVNIEAPFIRVTDDSKEADLAAPAEYVIAAMTAAIRRAKRAEPRRLGGRPRTTKDAIIDALPDGIQKATGGGRHRYSLRQLYYAIRPDLLEALGKQLDYNWFAQVVTAHEADTGADLPGIYRDSRGTLYHPHLDEEIALGTLAVEHYERPAWTFRYILYAEKEGLFPILRDAQWPERFDCALLTSKGFASRAARDVLDLLSESDEEITFFALHDADGYGTLIYESLQEATRARPGRRARVINLGLEPAEARDLDLQIETFARKKERAVPVAKYVSADDREWLQTHRVELNAMATPQFIAWLEEKFERHTKGKLVPPVSVMRTELRNVVRGEIEARITDEVLHEAGVRERVDAAVAVLDEKVRMRSYCRRLEAAVRTRLEAEPALSWRAPVADEARELVASSQK